MPTNYHFAEQPRNKNTHVQVPEQFPFGHIEKQWLNSIVHQNCKLKILHFIQGLKNNLMNSHTDMIVALDVLNNQYLYSCSRDGKLIIRDLINDDADKSYEVFMLMDGIGKIDLKLDKFTNTISVATCGKNSDLRLYTIDLELDNASKGNSKDPDQSDLTYVQSFRNRPLRRSFTTLSLEAPFCQPSYHHRGIPRGDIQKY